MILDVLKAIQARLGGLEDRMGGLEQRLGSVDQKLDHVATIVQKQRRDIAGILVMMKATAGDFDQRVTAMEERMASFESRS